VEAAVLPADAAIADPRKFRQGVDLLDVTSPEPRARRALAMPALAGAAG